MIDLTTEAYKDNWIRLHYEMVKGFQFPRYLNRGNSTLPNEIIVKQMFLPPGVVSKSQQLTVSECNSAPWLI